MMNRKNRVAGRTIFCHLKQTVGFIILLSLASFLLVYIYARSTSYSWNPSEFLISYLGGFRRADIFAIIWIIVHVPIQIYLFGQLMDTFNMTYSIRILKYRNKTIFCYITVITLIIETMTYYAIGYGMLLTFTDGSGLVIALWQAGLSCVETLNIVCSAFLFGQLFRSWENLAFPMVLVIELLNTLLCGAKEGVTRFLPFTQAKMTVQEVYFLDGTAMKVSLFIFGFLILVLTAFWVRKDERNGL